MKKLCSVLMMLLLVLALTACDSIPGQSGGSDSGSSSGSSSDGSSSGGSSSGGSSSDDGVYAEDGYGE